MIGLLPILARWRLGLSIFGALAFLGLALAANHYRHAYHAEKALRKADRANYEQAQAEAALLAQRALDAKEAEYRSKANEADKAFQSKLADARSAVDRYVSLHRVRIKAPQGATSPAIASAEGNGPGLPKDLSADPFVAVRQSDVQACSVDAVTANQAYHWAMGL